MERLPFLDHFQESFFVEATVANQGIVATLSQLDRHDIRLVFFDLLTNRFHRCRGHVGGPDKPKVFVDVNDRRGRHRGTSSTEERWTVVRLKRDLHVLSGGAFNRPKFAANASLDVGNDV